VENTDAIRQVDPVPSKYALDQNYPNPFNPTTMITFGLPKETNVTLEVYNILGMQVRTLIAGNRMNAGKYSVDWDGKDNSGMSVPSGVYLYRIQTDKFSAAKKMVLMK
jgi:flagellar hook assembly protein FlgD